MHNRSDQSEPHLCLGSGEHPREQQVVEVQSGVVPGRGLAEWVGAVGMGGAGLVGCWHVQSDHLEIG